eukprot:5583449-Prymnesium_polylepis.1
MDTCDGSALQDEIADTATDTRGSHSWGRLTPPQHPKRQTRDLLRSARCVCYGSTGTADANRCVCVNGLRGRVIVTYLVPEAPQDR